MIKYLSIILTSIILISCQQVKDTSLGIFDSTVQKTKKAAKKVWYFSLDKAFELATTLKKTSFRKLYRKQDSLNVQDIDGLQIEVPGFYTRFLKYKANKDAILSFIAHLPVPSSKLSDSTFLKTDSTNLYHRLDFIRQNQPYINNELNFFTEIRTFKNLEYYQCNRYPNQHYIVFNPATGIIYHCIDEYWD